MTEPGPLGRVLTRLGIRGRLVAVAAALTILVVIPGGLFLEARLRAEASARIDAELDEHAAAARVAVDRAPAASRARLAAELGDASARRVTIIAADGTVQGDSATPQDQLARLANHGDRPEIARARAGGRGLAERTSDTTGTTMRYVALRTADGSFVRLAQSLASIDAEIHRLRLLVLAAGVIALAATLVLVAAAGRRMESSLRALYDSAWALSGGGAAGGSPSDPRAEVEPLLAALAAERARLKTVLESLADAVLALAPDGSVTLANPAARVLLGVTGDPVGRSLLELIRAPALQDLLGPGATGDSVELDLPGTQRRVLVTVSAERSGSGRVLVLHDVTAVRRVEAMRRDFVANVSHELKTPISVVSANAETLLHGALEDRESAGLLVEGIARNADRLRLIVEDLLDLSRLDAGSYRLDLDDVGLEPAVRGALATVGPKAEARGTQLAVEIDPGLVVRADHDALEQILINLIDNAIKYTPHGGHVVISGRRVDNRVRVEVRDDGLGIAPAHRDRVFERFYRVDPGRSREVGGTGLGLAIVKHLVEAMGGRIGVEPNHPRGTAFWLELGPAAEPEVTTSSHG